jgi:hypothetical protein
MLRIAECLIYVHADEVPEVAVTDDRTAADLVGWYYRDTGGLFLPEHVFALACSIYSGAFDPEKLCGPYRTKAEATARLYRSLVGGDVGSELSLSAGECARLNSDRLALARWLFDSSLVTRELIRRYR